MGKKIIKPVEDQKPRGGLWNGIIAITSSRIGDLSQTLIPKVPPAQRSPLILAAISALLILAIAIGMLFRGSFAYPFGLALAFVILSFAIVLIYRPAPLTERLPRVDRVKPVATWIRIVPRLPIPEDALRKLGEQLDRILGFADAKLRALKPKLRIQSRDIRINVFLPDSSGAAFGDVCDLCIPNSAYGNSALHRNMEGSEELGLRFRPNQGLTGRVFISQEPDWVRAVTNSDGSRIWQGRNSPAASDYQLTARQEHLIHTDLRWLISFPLKVRDGESERTMGVLNIDGLHHELDSASIDALMGQVILHVVAFASELARQPKSRIMIVLEDIHDD